MKKPTVLKSSFWLAHPWENSSKKKYHWSLWRICDPFPLALFVGVLVITQFNDLTGKPMAIGLAILALLALLGHVIEPCWRKQLERWKQ